MARETTVELLQRAAADNERVAAMEPGSTKNTIFGLTVFTGELQHKAAGVRGDEWDCYWVEHSGFRHSWSTASIAAENDESNWVNS